MAYRVGQGLKTYSGIPALIGNVPLAYNVGMHAQGTPHDPSSICPAKGSLTSVIVRPVPVVNVEVLRH